MQMPGHLTRRFLTDVSDLLVGATSTKFTQVTEEGKQYKVKYTSEGHTCTVAFEGQPRDTKYVSVHFGEGETLVLAFNYIPNGEVGVVDYKRQDGVVAQSPRTVLKVIKAGLKLLTQEP